MLLQQFVLGEDGGHREARPELPMLRPKLPRMSQPDSEKVAEWLPSAGPGGGAGQDREIK